jgi:molybdate transport system ATP-binding protein
MSDETWIDPRRMAAVVYDDGVAIDLLLAVFAADLVAAGAQLGGVLHVPRLGPGCGPQALMQLRDLETGDIITLCQAEGMSGNGCTLDPAGIGHAARRIRAASEGDVDLVLLSRFGRQEAAGQGYSDALSLAVQKRRPVLTAVRRGLADNWLAACGGIGTVLEARLWVMKGWWRELGVPLRGSAAALV